MDFLSLLSKEVGEAAAGEMIEEKIRSFSGLLTREAAAKLIASEKGLIKEEFLPAAAVKPGANSVNLRGKVERILPLQQYASGKRSRVFVLSDDTGEAQVRLWNEDTEKLRRLHLGDEVEVRGAYEKMGSLNLGYRGSMKTVADAKFLPPSALEKGRANCTGKISKVNGYVDAEGGKRFSLSISDGEKTVDALLPEGSKKGEAISEGDGVIIEGAHFDGETLSLDAHSRIFLRRVAPNIFRGPLENVERKGEEWAITVGGREFPTGGGALTKLLNLEGLKEDIDLGSAVSAKLPGLKGKNVMVVFEEKEGGARVQEATIK